MHKLLYSTTFVVIVLLATLLMQACSASTPELSRQQTSPSTFTKVLLSQYEPPRWISSGSSFVKASNDTATIDTQIYHRLDVKTINLIVQGLQRYNSLVSSKHSSKGVILLSTSSTPSGNNCPPVTATTNWWGVTVFLNHCDITIIGSGGSLLSTAGGVAAGIAAILDATGIGLPITIVAGILALYSGALVLADNGCGDNGAYLNIPWIPVPWPAPVC